MSIVGIDPGIEWIVEALRAGGVKTSESCEGGHGHAMPEPTVVFDGGPEVGWQAMRVALSCGLPVLSVRQSWTVVDGTATGPVWEMTFRTPNMPHPLWRAPERVREFASP